MSSPLLIIDGYNLLYAAGMGQVDYQAGDLQHCRERLLRFLAARLKPAQILRALVIFDARDPPPDLPARRRQHGMQILFAQPHGDADLMIEELIGDHPHPRQVMLISSDQRLRRTARSHQAKSMTSEQFVAQLQQTRQTADADEDQFKQRSVSALETQKWLEAFGAIELRDEPLPPALLTRSGRPAIEKPAIEKPVPKQAAVSVARPVRVRKPPPQPQPPPPLPPRSASSGTRRRKIDPTTAPKTASAPANLSRRRRKGHSTPLPADRRQLTNDDLAYWLEAFRDLADD